MKTQGRRPQNRIRQQQSRVIPPVSSPRDSVHQVPKESRMEGMTDSALPLQLDHDGHDVSLPHDLTDMAFPNGVLGKDNGPGT